MQCRPVEPPHALQGFNDRVIVLSYSGPLPVLLAGSGA
jgi:hypothetical protein